MRCGTIANKTTIHQSPNDMDESRDLGHLMTVKNEQN